MQVIPTPKHATLSLRLLLRCFNKPLVFAHAGSRIRGNYFVHPVAKKHKHTASLWLGLNLFLTGNSSCMAAWDVFSMFYRADPQGIITQIINVHTPLMKGASTTINDNILFASSKPESAWREGNYDDLVVFAWLLEVCIYIYIFDEQPAYYVSHKMARDEIAFLLSGGIWFPLLTMMQADSVSTSSDIRMNLYKGHFVIYHCQKTFGKRSFATYEVV